MKKAPNILIVEDIAADAEMAEREICKVLNECTFHLVETRKDFLKALETFQPDVILSDYTLPRFDGLTALKLARKHAPFTPLIIWTGAHSEDTAVDCLKAGANNYVLKENIKRLGPAVLHALEERELLLTRKRAEEELLSSEIRFRTFVDHASDSFFLHDERGIILDVNRQACQSLGYTREELIGMTPFDFDVDITPTFIRQIGARLRAGELVTFDTRQRRKNGSVFPVEVRMRSFQEGGHGFAVSLVRDITERKKAEEEFQNNERRFRALIENGLDDISLLAADGTLLWESPSAVRNLGYAPGEFLQRNIFEIMHPDDLEWTQQVFAKLIQEQGSRQNGIFRLRRSDGTWRWVETIATNMLNEPSVNAIVINYRDITERKQAEDELGIAHDQLKHLFDNLDETVFSIDTTRWQVLQMSPACEKVYGRAPSEFLENSQLWREVILSEDLPIMEKNDPDLYAGKSIHQEYRIHWPNGEIHWLESSLTPTLDAEGRLIRLDGICANVTERKKVEEALRESEEKYRFLFDNSPLPLWIYDLETLAFLRVNHAAVHHYGYSIDEFMSMTIKDIRPSEDVPSLLDNIANVTNGIDEAGIWRHRKKDGTIIQVEIVSHTLEFEGRSAEMVLAIDVTERKWAEDLLQEERNLLRTLIDNIPDRIYAMDIHGRKTLSNTADWQASGGKTMQDVIGKTDFDTYPPDLAEEFWQLDKAVLESGQAVINYEEPGLDAEGNHVSILTTKIPLRDSEGKVIGLVGIGRDITERKQVEERINDLLAFNEKMFNHSAVGILTYEVSGPCVFANEKAASIVGTAVPQLMAQNFRAIESWKQSGLYDLVEKAITTLSPATADIHHVSTFGKDIWMTAHCITFKSKGEDHVLLSISDITERKQAEEKLRQSENRYRLAIKATNDVIWESNLQTKQLFWSENAQFVFGYSPEEVNSYETWWDDHLHPYDRERVLSKINGLIEGDEALWMDEYRFQLKNGSYAHISDRGYIERDANGTPLRMIGAMTDITERKQAEDKLRESENRLFMALSGAQMSVWEWNLKTNQIFWSPEFFKITGVQADQFGGTFESFTDLIHNDDVDRVRNAAEKAMQEQTLFAEEFRIICPDGEVRWLSNLGQAEYDSTGSHLRLIGTVQDVTQRKQAEIERQALLEIMQGLAHTADLQELLELIHHAIARVVYARNFFVVLYQPNTGLFEEIYSVDQYDPPAPPAKLEKSITSYVFRSGSPLLLTQVLFDELAKQGEVKLVGTNSASWLGVPLKTSGRTIGVMAVQDYEYENRYTERDKHFLASIAAQVALVIERKQTEQALTLFRSLIDHSSDVIEVVDPETGRFIDVNEQACRAHGYTREEYLALAIDDIDPLAAMHPQLAGDTLVRSDSLVFESTHRRKDGSVFPVEVNLNHVRLDRPYNLSVVRDITERKLAETALIESNAKFRGLFEASPDAILLVDPNNEWPILDCNTAACQLNGFTREELVGQSIDILNLTAGQPNERANYLERIRQAGVLRLETGHRHKNGTIIPIEVSTSLIRLGGRDVILGIDRDATERKRMEVAEREQRALAEALRDTAMILSSTLDFGEVLDHILSAVERVVPHEAGTIMLIEDGYAHVVRSHGYDQLNFNAEIMGIRLPLTNTTNLRQMVETRQPVVVYDTHTYPGWTRMPATDWLRSSVSAPISIYGEMIGFICLDGQAPEFFTPSHAERLEAFANQAALAIHNARLLQQAQEEIAERKRVEEALRQSENKAMALLNALPDLMFRLDRKGTILDYKADKSDLYAQSEPYLIGQKLRHISPPEFADLIDQYVEQTLSSGEMQVFEYQLPIPGQGLRDYEARMVSSGKDEVTAIVRNITERKQAEEELRASEERFRQLADNIQEVFWMTDAESNEEIYMSPAAEVIWGQPLETLLHEPNAFINSIFPEDLPNVLQNIEKEKNGEKAELEYRIVRPDGSLRWVWDRAFPIFDDSGKVKRIAGISADITERRESELALVKSQSRYRELFDSSPVSLWEEDFSLVKKRVDSLLKDGVSDLSEYFSSHPEEVRELASLVIIIDANQASLDLYKVGRKQDLPKSLTEALGENTLAHFQDEILELLGPHKKFVWEGAEITPDGRQLELVVTGSIPQGYEEDWSKVIISITDITERKRAEENLRESEARYHGLFQNLVDGFALHEIVTDDQGKPMDYVFLEVNPAFEKMTGLDAAQITGRRVTEVLPGVENERFIPLYGQVAQTEKPVHFQEYSIPLEKYFEINAYSPKPGQFAVTFVDITERKQAENEIHRRAEVNSILLKTSLALTNLDLKATLQTVGDSAKNLFAADGCRIFLMEPDGKFLRCVLALQESSTAFSDLRVGVGEGVTGAVAARGQAEIVNQMQNDPRSVQVTGTPEEEEAIMFAPLKERDNTIGVISVRRTGTDRPFGPSDLALLEALASMAASAVSNARLFTETERRLVELEALYENGLAVGRLLKPSEIGDRIINTFARYLPWHHVTIRLRQDASDNLELVAFNLPSLKEEERAHAEQHFVARINNVGQGLSGWVIQTGMPLRTGNVHIYPQYIDTHAGIQSGLYMPLKVGERVIGVISVESEAADAFTEQDERLLATLASQAAIAFENARLYQSVQQELMERKRVEDELRESRERFQNLFENSPVATWLEDFSGVADWMNTLRAQGVENLREYLAGNIAEFKHGIGLIRILDVNRAAVEINGAASRDDLINRIHHRMINDTPQEIMLTELEMIWKGIRSFGFELVLRKQDNSVITSIQHVFIPVKDGRPEFESVILTSLDISDRVNIEKELRASEVHYRELADSITDILFELDEELCYIHWNKASEEFSGISAEDAIGKSMKEIFGTAEEQSKQEEIYRSVLKEQQARTFEMEAVSNGQKQALEINAYPSARGVSVVAKDVTDRKRSEIIMQKRFELMEYSAHHALDELMQRTVDEVSELTGSTIGFFHFVQEDQNTLGMQTWSTKALQLFNVPISEGAHLTLDQAGVWAEAVHQRRPLIHNDYEALTHKKGLPRGHVPIRREIVIPILRNEKVMAVMGIGNKPQEYTSHDLEVAERLADYAWDITERKQMQVALEMERNQLAKRVEERTSDLSQANSNLARALRVKDEFLANMSHELRTPLNAILGLSESLGEQIAGPLNEKQQKYITTISESGHHLLSLINDILDLAKIEAGQITLDINKVDIHQVCQASLRMIKQLAQKKNQDVVLEIDNGIGLMWADERRLKQMIVNLMGNAVKFTPEHGKIGLEVRGDQVANKVTITVWDNGIGIKEEDLTRLFQPFVQLDSGLAREATGTGLGLALVAQMARLHGGSVTAVSEAGKGSHFSIILPWEPALAIDTASRLRTTGKFPAIKPDETNKPTILLVEDTKEVVMMIRDYLELAGYKVVVARDGVEAIAQARLIHPGLILMDVMMPRMDGFEATRKLRSEPEFKYTPIIALTALAMPSDRERCLAAGMDEYISKPINLKALIRMIQSCLFNSKEPTSE